ncbi:MAG: biopolymer transporter ExbD [Planctomycetes bacterium]|nr:biopolymer transporter ExbD [Planctomycetota bacterium]
MALKPKADTDSGIADLNLTPMIDVTFQLLIFFMVCSEMAKQDQIAELHLPKADAAKPDDKPEVNRLVINVLPAGDGSGVRYIVAGEDRNDRALRAVVYKEAELARGEGGFSTRPVLIRADQDVNYGYVQRVMDLLMQYKIWKISFGASKPEVR